MTVSKGPDLEVAVKPEEPESGARTNNVQYDYGVVEPSSKSAPLRRRIPCTGDTSSSLGRICLPGQPHLKFRGQPPGWEVSSRATDSLKSRG